MFCRWLILFAFIFETGCKALLALVLLAGITPSAAARASQFNLPAGVGAVRLQHRSYHLIDRYYDQHGKLKSLSDKYSQDLYARELTDDHADLERLVNELNQFANDPLTNARLGDALYLGRVYAAAQARLNATAFGFAYGLTDRWMVSAGVPLIDIQVKAQLDYDRSLNNAGAIKQRLGDLAYEELQAGLDDAQQIETSRLYEQVENLGYEPIKDWSYKGLGDLYVGGQYADTALINELPYDYSYGATVIIPHGHRDDPANLVDQAISQGYWSLGVKTEHALRYKRLGLSSAAEVQENFATTKDVRLPAGDELLVDGERQTSVRYTPGRNYAMSLRAQGDLAPFGIFYVLAYDFHAKDHYRGGASGNYAKLAENSQSFELSQRFGVSVDTVSSYLRKQFFLPFTAALSYYEPWRAKNRNRQSYVALEFTGFWTANSTPLASSTERPKRTRKK